MKFLDFIWLYFKIIVALLHVLAMHARVLTIWPVHHTWQQLVGIPIEIGTPLAVAPREKEVPLLLTDPTALLIQLILLLPLHLDQIYFSSVVKAIYNLLYYQVIVQISCGLNQDDRSSLLDRMQPTYSRSLPFQNILSRVVEYFKYSKLYRFEDYCKPSTSTSKSTLNPNQIELQVGGFDKKETKLSFPLRDTVYFVDTNSLSTIFESGSFVTASFVRRTNTDYKN